MSRRDDILEMQADILLRKSGGLGREAGSYTEKQLRRHTWREVNDEITLQEAMDRASREAADMSAADLRGLASLAGLTAKQSEVWDLRSLGLTVEEIAGICGVTRQAVFDRLERARERVCLAMTAYPWFGLWDVYRELMRRRGKDPR